MAKILATPKVTICFPKKGLGWEALGNQWSNIASQKSHKGCIVKGEEGELKR